MVHSIDLMIDSIFSVPGEYTIYDLTTACASPINIAPIINIW